MREAAFPVGAARMISASGFSEKNTEQGAQKQRRFSRSRPAGNDGERRGSDGADGALLLLAQRERRVRFNDFPHLFGNGSGRNRRQRGNFFRRLALLPVMTEKIQRGVSRVENQRRRRACGV